jgi:hypothetical protein
MRSTGRNMKKVILGVVLTLCLLVLFSSSLSPAFAVSKQKSSTDLQLTTNPKYDRNPSLFQAKDGTWWLFFTRGTSEIGVRDQDGYVPDLDSYDIYYKTAKSLPGLQDAIEFKVPGSDPTHGQRDVAAMQASDGKIWVFSSTGFGPGDNHIYYFTYNLGTWQGPVAVNIEESLWIGHINVLEYQGKIWLFYDAEYFLKSTYYDGSWHGPYNIASEASLGKAIVDNGMFYIVWAYVNPNTNSWGPYIGLSTSTDGISWTNIGQIVSWPAEGATNWDPVLIKEKRDFRLIWAPDAGSEGQFIATSVSRNPTDPTTWSNPVAITTAHFGTESWWDFWPQPISVSKSISNSVFLVYTSERSGDGTSKSDGNIWLRLGADMGL